MVVIHNVDSIDDIEGTIQIFDEIAREANEIPVHIDRPVYLVYRMEKTSPEGLVGESIVRSARYMREYVETLQKTLSGDVDKYDLFVYKDIVGSDLPHTLSGDDTASIWRLTHVCLVDPSIPQNRRVSEGPDDIVNVIKGIPMWTDHNSNHGFFNGKFDIKKIEELYSKENELNAGEMFWLDYIEHKHIQKSLFEDLQIPLLITYKTEEFEKYDKEWDKIWDSYCDKSADWEELKIQAENENKEFNEPKPIKPSKKEWMKTLPAPFNKSFRLISRMRKSLEEDADYNFWKKKAEDITIADTNSILSIPCGIYALAKAGVTNDVLSELQANCFNIGSTIKTGVLSKVLNKHHYQLCLHSTRKKKDNTITKYPDKLPEGWTSIHLDTFDNHLFVHKVFYSKRAKKEVSVLTALKQGFSSGILKPYSAYDLYNNFSNFTLDPMISFNIKQFFDETPAENTAALMKYTSEIKLKSIKGYPDKVYYADFESTTDEQHHIPYMVHCIGPDIDKTFIGEDCARKMFESVANLAEFIKTKTASGKIKLEIPNIRFYFHNLKYDMGFMRGQLKNVDEVCKGTQLYSAEGTYGPTKPIKYIKFQFWDTLPIMRCRLSKAVETYIGAERAKAFRKEACPYSFYTRRNFAVYSSGWVNIEEFCKGFNNENDLERFMEIIKEMPPEIYDKDNNLVNYMKYSAFYCRQDVLVMKEAFENIRKLFLGGEIEGVNGSPPFEIDILNHRTASSIAWRHFLNCFNAKNVYMVKGALRVTGRNGVRGGRTMLGDNTPYHYISPDPKDPDWDIVDYDAVSLYPTAGSRAWIAEGFPFVIKTDQKWTQKEFLEWFDNPEAEQREKKYSDGWIYVTKLHAKKHRKFPMICVKDPKTKLNNYTNFNNQEVDTIISMIDLYNFVDYQEGEFEWSAAIVWNGSRNFSCRKVFQDLNEFRKKNHNLKDSEGNDIPDHPIANLSKLVSNSIYGKTNQKLTNYQTVIVDRYRYVPTRNKKPDGSPVFERRNAWDEYFNTNAYRIIDFEYMPGFKEHVKVRQYRTDDSSALLQLAMNILALSKRSIGAVTNFAEDVAKEMGVPGPFYTDTDSLHLIRKTLPEVERRFEAKYGYKLAGPDLGQYHIDFDKPSNFGKEEKVRGAIESIFCAKKVYADKLEGTQGTIGFHQRMKGICSSLVEWKDFEDFYNDLPVYKDLAEAKPIFRYDGGVAYTLHHMTRRVMSRACRARLLEELHFKQRAQREITDEEYNLIIALNKAIHEEEEGPTVSDCVVIDCPSTPPLETQPPVEIPWENPEPAEWMEGDTQELILDEETQFPGLRPAEPLDDEIDIETEDEEERPLKIPRFELK